MSWLFSRALVEEFLEGNCSDGAQSALSSTTPDSTSMMFTPFKSPRLKKFWKIVSVKRKRLLPGDQFSFINHIRNTLFNTGFYESQTDEHHTALNTEVIWMRTCGLIAHDSTNVNAVGFGAGHVDIVINQRMDVFYDAGQSIVYQQTLDEADAMPNGGDGYMNPGTHSYQTAPPPPPPP